MVTSYNAGAKYISVFNYPETGPYGLLTQEHFEAFKQFNTYVSNNPKNKTSNHKKIAYVLPENYGWECEIQQTKYGEFGKQMRNLQLSGVI